MTPKEMRKKLIELLRSTDDHKIQGAIKNVIDLVEETLGSN